MFLGGFANAYSCVTTAASKIQYVTVLFYPPPNSLLLSVVSPILHPQPCNCSSGFCL